MGTREAAALLRRAARGASVPAIRYDESLPVHARRAEIAAAIARSPVVIVSGATGSGKSTQIPKICLELGRGLDGMIGHTQPRRIAAHALAGRLAAELGTAVGDLVGYQVRFVDRTSPRTLVKLMTDGVLLRELERDPWLNRYDTLILDEAHERNLNLDFLLGICRRLVTRRPELRVVVTSATIETRRFAEYFDGAPVIEVEGRSFPVELRYRPIDPEEEAPTPLASAVQKAVGELAADSRGIKGDALVFLPGERQIQESLELLKREGPGGYELLPLYSRLSTPDQERIYAPHALAAGSSSRPTSRRPRSPSPACASWSIRGSPASAATARVPSCSVFRSSRSPARAPTSARDAADAKARASASGCTPRKTLPRGPSTPSPRSVGRISRA